jgi:WD40 repeat protein/serine/threonine protein kinase
MIANETSMWDREQHLDEVIADYLRAVHAGEAPDPQQWLALYPDLAAELAEFFADREQVERLARPLRTIVSGAVVGTIGGPWRDYELLEEIGRGGMGVVYRARQIHPSRVVALKMIRGGQFASRADVQRFQSEAEAAASLDHPHIVPIYEVGEEQSQHYFSMKLIDGQSLAQRLQPGQASSGLEIRQLVKILAEVARAVHYAHQRGILHRDLKPGNILLESRAGNGTSPVPYVTDFGLAKRVADDDTGSQSGSIVGTASYMAPEQAAGGKGLTTAADVYSLGAILYEMLTGRPPFREETPLETLVQVREREPARPSSVHPQVDRDLETICLKCLDKDPHRRYGSAEALAEEFDRWLTGEPIEGRSVSGLERAWRRCKRNPVVSSLLAAVVLVAVVGLAGVLSQWEAAVASEQKAVANEQKAVASEDKAKEHAAQAQAKAQEAAKQCDEARRQQAEAQRQRDEVQRQRDLLGAANERLLATQQQLQSTLYAAHINLAQRAWEVSGSERVLQLLDQHRPKPDQADLRGFEWHYLNRLCHSNELTFEGHTAQVCGMALSSDAKRLATASADHTVKVWDAQTGKELLTLKGHSGSLIVVVFSRDGKRLASASREPGAQGNKQQLGEVKLWDAQTGGELVTLKDAGGINALALSPDNKHLAGESSDGTIKIWDTQTSREYLTLKGTDRPKDEWVAALAFSPDGTRLAAGIHNLDYTNEQRKRLGGKVKLWDAESGRELFTLKGHARSVNSVLFSPDGKRLASGSMDATVKVWNPQTGQELLTLPGHTDYNWPPMAYSPDGRRLAVGCDNTVKLWDAQTGQELATLKCLNGYANCLALAEDGRCLAGTRSTSSSYGAQTATVKTWDTRKDREGLTFKVGSGHIYLLAYSPDGTRLAALTIDGPKVLDARTGKEVFALEGHSEEVCSLAFSPDGKRLATSSHDKTVKVWDTQTGKELVTKTLAEGATGVAFSPDGKRLASTSASWDNTTRSRKGSIKLWDTESWTEVRTIASGGSYGDVAFAPDGKRLAGVSSSVVTIWDLETGRPALTLRASGSYRWVSHLAVSPDGKRVAGGGSNTLFIWDAQTGRQLLTLDGHYGNICQLAFSPDGKRLVSADYDRTVKLWDAESGRELLSFAGGGGAAFSPDGRRVARGTRDGTVEIWDATPLPEKEQKEQKPVQRAYSRQVAEGWSPGGSFLAVGSLATTDDYEMGLDTTVRHGGRASASIKSKVPAPSGFATINQGFRADDYRAKRLRLSGYVKTENAEQGAWLWMRLDCETQMILDNMQVGPDRRITGTSDWRICEIVLDVPKDAVTIAFGIALSGKGQAWFDDLTFEIVAPDVPVTNSFTGDASDVATAASAKPVNLDFESQRSPAPPPQPPPCREVAKGWTVLAPDKPDGEIGLDSNVRHSGNRSLFIKSKVPRPSRIPTRITQQFWADDYRGKRLRLSGYVKTEDVEQAACLYLNLNCRTRQVVDSMEDRPITGTRDWRICEIVLDVPEDVLNIVFGVSLLGNGQAWFDDLQFDVVGQDVPTTTPSRKLSAEEEAEAQKRRLPPRPNPKPVNLDFEDEHEDVPVGWHPPTFPGAGEGYATGLDHAVHHTGKASGFIKAVSPEPKGFSYLLQSFSADDYRGKRLRMSAYVKGDNLDIGAWLWMGVYGASGRVLAADWMRDRKIKGTSDWKRYEIVLDVPAGSVSILFGFGMHGKGQVWADDFQFEIVGQDVPTTKPARSSAVPTTPVNLDLEHEREQMPVGWDSATGPGVGEGFATGLDHVVHHTGKASGFIKAVSPEPWRSESLTQSFSADDYRGKRLRMSAYVKHENLDIGAWLWMRVDGENRKMLAFDSMDDRRIKGTSDWKKYEIVLDLPATSTNITFGFAMNGKGQVWADDFQFEVVGQDVPTTKPAWSPPVPTTPVNLDFEQ